MIWPSVPLSSSQSFHDTPQEVYQHTYANLRVRNLSDKAIGVASGLGNCGLKNQEALLIIAHDSIHPSLIMSAMGLCRPASRTSAEYRRDV